MDASSIVSAGVPLLCVDTCSILDIMRDPTRETARPHDRQAAIDIVACAEGGNLVCLAAEQVLLEFAEHDQPTQAEAESNLRKMRDQVERVSKLATIYGAPQVAISLAHLDDHVSRARQIVDRWLNVLRKVTPETSVPAKAFSRMNAGIAPARRGKDSSKDCLIYETYIEAVATLRNAGVRTKIVFLSSNTKEYLSEARVLKASIAEEFEKIDLHYAPNMSAAKHSLKL